jgi:hypothetical protein
VLLSFDCGAEFEKLVWDWLVGGFEHVDETIID